MTRINRKSLIGYLRNQFAINWMGHHGLPHWARVRANGLMLAKETGANVHVVELFAWFHDSRRVNENVDDGHGKRGAILAAQLKGRFFDATDREMDLLTFACDFHSDSLKSKDATVLTCWDSDRLDLGRVGMTVNPRFLGTDAARREVNLRRSNVRALSWRDGYDRRQHG